MAENRAPAPLSTQPLFRPGAIDLALLIAAGLIWGLTHWAWAHHGLFMTAHCASHPELCDVGQIAWFDRIALNRWDPVIDKLSFASQDLTVALALLLPFLIRRGLALKRVLAEETLVLLTIVWNGAMTEISRVTFQRARPFVYQDVHQYAFALAHYTSFVSGHTSAAAAAATIGFLIARARGLPATPLRMVAGAGIVLTLVTGASRVMAGRHFPSDVLGGAALGVLVANLVFRYRKNQRRLA